MKVVKVGRSSTNDIVIDNDSKVSRTHCQIILDDAGNFRLIDINSTNGTFVNGIRRQGEVFLNTNDIVRIGDTTLPWQSYFNVEGPTPPRPGGNTSPFPSNKIYVLKIGRACDNDIVINDPFVSDHHCQIIRDAYNNFTLIDNGSKNGTTINGVKRSGKIELRGEDIVRIGNTTLPWRQYFLSVPPQPVVGVPGGSGTQIPAPGESEPLSENKMSIYAIIAFVLSLIGVGFFIYAFIQIIKFGAPIGYSIMGAKVPMLISFGVSIVAYIVSEIYDNFSDDTSDNSKFDFSSIAQYISGFCTGAIIIFYVYMFIKYPYFDFKDIF